MTEKSLKYPKMQEVVDELKKMTDIGFPIVAMSLVDYIKNLISVVCMGRLGSLELAGGALAIGFTNITGYSLLSGLAMGMEPLCSQAFGSRNFSLLSLTLQRTIIMLLFTSIFIGLLWLNLEPLMIMLHQDPDITGMASLYCRFALPDLVASSLLHPIRIFLRNKGTTWPLMWCSLLAILVHLPITIYLAFTLSFGLPAIAISTFITNFSTLFLLLTYMYFTRETSEEESFDPLSWCRIVKFLYSHCICLHDHSLSTPLTSQEKHQPLALPSKTYSFGEEWKMLLKLSIPSCAAVCLEWWWYEFMTLSAGYLTNPQAALGTSAIVIQTTSLMYTLPAALSASVSTRVGHELGAGRPEKARLATVAAIGMALVASMLGLVGTTLGRKLWGQLFTQDNEVLDLTMVVLPIIGLCELGNCPQTTSCGILRGSARPGIGAGINFYSFYLVGAPVAIFLAFFWELGFVGLCYGLLAAQVACVVSILVVVFKTDWENESLKAKDLVGNNGLEEFSSHQVDQTPKCEESQGFLKETTYSVV